MRALCVQCRILIEIDHECLSLVCRSALTCEEWANPLAESSFAQVMSGSRAVWGAGATIRRIRGRLLRGATFRVGSAFHPDRGVRERYGMWGRAVPRCAQTWVRVLTRAAVGTVWHLAHTPNGVAPAEEHHSWVLPVRGPPVRSGPVRSRRPLPVRRRVRGGGWPSASGPSRCPRTRAGRRGRDRRFHRWRSTPSPGRG